MSGADGQTEHGRSGWQWCFALFAAALPLIGAHPRKVERDGEEAGVASGVPPGAPFPKFASHLARCSNFYRLATASWQEKPASPVRKPHCLIAKKASGKATITGRGIGGFPQPRFTFPYKRLPPAASLQLSFCRTVYILFYFIPTDSLSLSCSRRLDDIHSRSISVLVFCFCFFFARAGVRVSGCFFFFLLFIAPHTVISP